MNRKQKQWEDKLSANKAGAQNNAEEFTKQFMQDMYSESSMTNIETREEMTRSEETHAVIIGKSPILFFGDVIIQLKKFGKNISCFLTIFSPLDQNVKNEGLSIKQEQQTPIPPKKALQAPPALPPKTKIMNSPSRHLFSPSSDITDSAVEGAAYSSSNDTATTVEYIPGYYTFV